MKRITHKLAFDCDNCHGRRKCIFSKLESELLASNSEKFEQFEFDRDEKIQSSIDGKHGFHIIRAGNALVSFREGETKVVSVHGPGDLVGFGAEKFPGHEVTALGKINTCFLFNNVFKELLKESNILSQVALDYLCAENLKKSRHIYSIANYSVRKRVHLMLLELAREFGVKSSFGTKINIKLNRSALSDLSGSQNETLARTLTALEKDKVIVREKWDIHLTDLART